MDALENLKKSYSRLIHEDDYFKDKYSFEKRKSEACRILSKYPDRTPIIVEKVLKSDLPTIDKKKYLVPKDLTAVQFLYVIRKRLALTPEKAIFLFVGKGNTLLTSGDLISQVYEEYKDEDGFLYVFYSGENAFG